MDAGTLVAGPADLTRVVGREERPDDELARLDGADVTADLFDDTDVLVAHRSRAVDAIDAAIGPEVGAADARRRQSDDGVGRFDDRGLWDVLDSYVARSVKDGCKHELPLLASFFGYVVTMPAKVRSNETRLLGVLAVPPSLGRRQIASDI